MTPRGALLILCLALAACRGEAGPTRVAPSKAPVATVASAKPSPRAAKGPVLLAKPATPTTVLAGTVVVDPAYIVAQGGGNIISTNSAGIVAQGGGNVVTAGPLITNDGGSLITNDGGSIISNDGASIVAQGAGNIVAQGGGNIVAQGGGNLLATDDVTIVAQGGGNIVAQGGGNYRLAATPTIEPGTQLPAAGMALGAYSLTTGKYVPLGVDAQGQPVYTAYSNLKGAYEVYVPAAAGNVMLVANVPGQRDYRLAFNLLNGTAARIDDDTAMVTKLLRLLMYGRFQVYLAQAGAQGPVQLNNDLDRAFAAATGDFLERVRAGGKRLSAASVARRAEVARRMAELVLPGPEGLATVAEPLETLEQVMGQLRKQAPGYYQGPRLAKLLADAQQATDAFNTELVAGQAGVTEPYRVPFGFTQAGFKKDSDLADFMVRGLIAPNVGPLTVLKDQLLRDVGLTDAQYAALHNAELGLMVAVGSRLTEEAARNDVLKVLDAP